MKSKRASVAIRWVLVLPAAYAGYGVAMALSVGIYALGIELCPKELLVSGSCAWPRWVDSALFSFSAGAAAFLTIVLGTMVAPGYRQYVCWALFVVGGIFAAWMLATIYRDAPGEGVVPALAAYGFGLATASVLWRRYRTAQQTMSRIDEQQKSLV